MKRSGLFLLIVSLIFISVGCSNENHHAQGILLETMSVKAIEYDQLEELILASDLIVEARVLDHQEIIEDPSYPRTTISTLYIEDILYAKNAADKREIKIIEQGDYRYHLDVVKSGENHLLFLMEADDRLGELPLLVKDPQMLLEATYVAVDQWQGKYNITEEKTTYFYADKDRVKPFQEYLSNLPHQQMKEEIRTAIAKSPNPDITH